MPGQQGSMKACLSLTADQTFTTSNNLACTWHPYPPMLFASGVLPELSVECSQQHRWRQPGGQWRSRKRKGSPPCQPAGPKDVFAVRALARAISASDASKVQCGPCRSQRDNITRDFSIARQLDSIFVPSLRQRAIAICFILLVHPFTSKSRSFSNDAPAFTTRNPRGEQDSTRTPNSGEPTDGGVAKDGRMMGGRRKAGNAGSGIHQELVYGQHNLDSSGLLRLAPRPALRRVEGPASVLSNHTRRVTFVGAAETRQEKKVRS